MVSVFVCKKQKLSYLCAYTSVLEMRGKLMWIKNGLRFIRTIRVIHYLHGRTIFVDQIFKYAFQTFQRLNLNTFEKYIILQDR